MKTTIYASADQSCETLQQIIEDAMTAKYLRETRPPLPNPAMAGYVNLSGATIYHTMLGESDGSA